jgi:hypothetical protein
VTDRTNDNQGQTPESPSEPLLLIPHVDFKEDTGHELVELRKTF